MRPLHQPHTGTDKVNVDALQRALKAAGYYTGTIDGDFGTTTKTALEDWQADQGLGETGKITTSRFIWVPRGAVIESWSVGLGSSASAGTSLATVEFPAAAGGHRSVSQADITKLKVGQKAQLTVSSATDMTFTGTIASIASQPASSSSSTSRTVRQAGSTTPSRSGSQASLRRSSRACPARSS